MKKRILGGAVAACMALPALGGALPMAAAGGNPDRTTIHTAAMDYHFMLEDGSDFPKRLHRGKYRFTFENQSKKRLHEIVMFKLRHGKTIKQTAEHAPEEGRATHSLHGASFAKPGREGKTFRAKLIPGRYVLLCFVQNRKNAPPHFTKGMLHRFNVFPRG